MQSKKFWKGEEVVQTNWPLQPSSVPQQKRTYEKKQIPLIIRETKILHSLHSPCIKASFMLKPHNQFKKSFFEKHCNAWISELKILQCVRFWVAIFTKCRLLKHVICFLKRLRFQNRFFTARQILNYVFYKVTDFQRKMFSEGNVLPKKNTKNIESFLP